jgi:hypothetical protein
LQPNDFFETIFEPPVRNDELLELAPFLKFMDLKEFNSLIKRFITVSKIELRSPDRSISNRLAISPPKLEFFGDETRYISVINMYSGPMPVQAFASGLASVRPESAMAQPYSEVRLAVQLTGDSTTIEIRSEDGIVSIPIRKVKEPMSARLKLGTKYFQLSQKVIDFGMCDVGGVRKINVSVTSLSEKAVDVAFRSIDRSWRLNERVFDVPSAVRVGPFAQAEFILEFRPTMEMDFQECFLAECWGQKRKLRVSGRGIIAQKGFLVGADSQSLEFPACEVGRVKRGRLRVNNKSDRAANLVAFVSPPFVSPVATFSVEPNCYVLFPVHFAPKAPGSFSGSARFRSDTSSPFSVALRGRAYRDDE